MGTVLAVLVALSLAQGAPTAPPVEPPSPAATEPAPPATIATPPPATIATPPSETIATPPPATIATPPPATIATPPPATIATPPPATAPPPEELAPPPLPAPPPEPPAYGYAGMSELSLALGYSSVSGVLGGAGFRRFVVDGLAPGVEASVQTGSGTTVGLLLATLRLAPVRARQLAVVVTGRAGRVFLSHHDDGWGAGGGLGVIWFLSPHAGLELGYDVLWLLPQSFCGDLTSCTVQGPEIGLRLSF